jgi:hypothetical protein
MTLAGPPPVAVVDTGLVPGLPAALPGINVSGCGAPQDTSDRRGHGTAIARTIWATDPGVRVVPVKAIGEDGVLREPTGIEAALRWVCEHREELGIAVVCLAVADATQRTTDAALRDTPVRHLITRLWAEGVPTVVPAGNRRLELRLRHGAQGNAWPAILREVVSVGAAQIGPEGALRLSARTQRLHRDIGTGCATTIFAVPGPPDGTSGAAAVVAGRLAALRRDHPHDAAAELLARLLRRQRLVRDDDGLRWPCLPASDDERPLDLP